MGNDQRLDKKKPYSEIWGGNVPARYEQEGRYYDNQGQQVDLKPEHFSADTAQPANPPPPVAVASGSDPDAPGAPATNTAPASSAATTTEQSDAEVRAVLAEDRQARLLKAIPLMEKGQAELIPDLPDHDVEDLQAMLVIENAGKKRARVIDALEQELLKKRAEHEQDTIGTDAAGVAGAAGDQVSTQLAT